MASINELRKMARTVSTAQIYAQAKEEPKVEPVQVKVTVEAVKEQPKVEPKAEVKAARPGIFKWFRKPAVEETVVAPQPKEEPKAEVKAEAVVKPLETLEDINEYFTGSRNPKSKKDKKAAKLEAIAKQNKKPATEEPKVEDKGFVIVDAIEPKQDGTKQVFCIVCNREFNASPGSPILTTGMCSKCTKEALKIAAAEKAKKEKEEAEKIPVLGSDIPLYGVNFGNTDGTIPPKKRGLKKSKNVKLESEPVIGRDISAL